MKAGMYPQAISLLEKRVNEKPTDVDAHYELGVCYINTGNFRGADQKFASAVKLKPDYGYKIGGEYKRVGDESLNNGKFREANRFYQQAVKYQPDLKDGIVNKAFGMGSGYFNNGKYNKADGAFSIAVAFDKSLNQKVSDLYFQKGQPASENECVNFYRRTARYSKSHNKEIGDRLLAISKTKQSEKETQRWRKIASNFIEVPPDYIIITEKSFLIDCPDGKPSKFYRTKSNNLNFYWNKSKDHFYIQLRSGKKITLEELRKKRVYIGKKEFRIVPTKNEPLDVDVEIK